MSKEIDDLTADLAERKQSRSKLYSEVSSKLKAAAISADVSFKRQNLMASTGRPRVDLNNLEDVRQRTNDFLLACEGASVIPSFLGLCASMGYTRQGIYSFLSRAPESKSAQFLEVTREMLADTLIASGLNRTTDSAVSIFCLKNLHGFVDRVSIEAVAPDNPLGPQTDAQELSERYAELPED